MVTKGLPRNAALATLSYLSFVASASESKEDEGFVSLFAGNWARASESKAVSLFGVIDGDFSVTISNLQEGAEAASLNCTDLPKGFLELCSKALIKEIISTWEEE
jgi:hypothetical protein